MITTSPFAHLVETCINIIKKYEEVGIDQVLCFLQFGKLPHQKVMDSIRLIGKYVISYFQLRGVRR